MSGTTHTPGSLNQAAAHDTGLYDPAVHDNQIVALYDTDAEAKSALRALRDAGFPDNHMQVLARGSQHRTPSTIPDDTGSGFWGAIRSLFVPDEDRTTFNHAIAHGHAMLIVTPDHTMDRHHLIKVLESTHPLDFDAKLEEWRQAGYDATHAQPQSAPAATDDRLRIGKREAGAGRVRSYIVDRPAPSGEFGSVQERSVQARATADEPAIGRAPGAMSAVGPGQDATTRTGSLPGTTNGNPNATPAAGTSGANTPRR